MRFQATPLLFSSLFFAAGASAQTEVGPADDVESAINALGPGDELVLRGGMYNLPNERFGISVVGTEMQPIVIRAKMGERPHLHRPNAFQNIIDIDNAEYVTIRGIEFSGGSAGIRISAARFLTIEDCEIHDSGDVALRANDGGTYESMRILRNHIHHTNDTGEGMYLGCNNNGCRLANCLIEGNYIHHTNQPTVQQGDGIELKEGSYNNIIRDNVIHDTNYPCILTYSAVGNGPPNIIERNVMWNCGDHGIQSAADATIRNNIILSAGSDGIAMQPHQAGSPSNHVVVHNTILHANNDAISLRGTSGSVIIANNALYAQNGNAIFVSGGNTSGLVLAGNVGVGGVSGASGGFTMGNIMQDFVNGNFSGAPPMDLFPTMGGALIGAGDVAYVVVDDFNGTLRNGVADVGAYAYAAGGNPGWMIQEAFKGSTPLPPPTDAGMPSRDGGAAVPDGGTSAEDSGSVDPDSGTSTEDSGAGDPDGGTSTDSGQVDPDSGTSTDSGTRVGSDGGSQVPDSGLRPVDGGTERLTPKGGVDSIGCGCRIGARSENAQHEGVIWMLVMVGLWPRRRR